MQEQIGVILVGLGRIGQRHKAILDAHPAYHIVATVDPTTDGKDSPSHFRKLDEALLRIKGAAQLGVICSPNGVHAAQAVEALHAGLDVVIEKPLGLTAQSCQQVVDTAKVTGRRAWVVMQNRAAPIATWLHDTCHAGAFGSILSAQLNLYWNRGPAYYNAGGWQGSLAQDGGTLYTQFSHFIDLLVWCLGMPQVLHATASNHMHPAIEVDDTVHATLRLPGGGTLQLAATTCTPEGNFESSLTLIGEQGLVKMSGQHFERLEALRLPGMSHAPSFPAAEIPSYLPANLQAFANHALYYDQVANALAGGPHTLPDATEGLAVVQLIEQIYAAAGPIRR